MVPLLDWLDKHNGAVMAIATVAGVLVAAVYAYVTLRLWTATREQARLTREIFEVTHRPWLSIEPVQRFGFSEVGVRLDFQLRNHGTAPAVVTGWGLRWGLHPQDTDPAIPTTGVRWFIVPQAAEWAIPLDLRSDAAAAAWRSGVRFDATVAYQGTGPARYATRLLGTLRVTNHDAFVVESVRQDGDFL